MAKKVTPKKVAASKTETTAKIPTHLTGTALSKCTAAEANKYLQRYFYMYIGSENISGKITSVSGLDAKPKYIEVFLVRGNLWDSRSTKLEEKDITTMTIL